MRIVTVVGARPQFVKAATVSRAIAQWNATNPSRQVEECLVHTGQHFDHNMSQVFFDELDIPRPTHNLTISGGGHGQMTGRMLERLEEVLLSLTPDCVLVYGDTNSTLAGALAAVKLHIPVVHVESGLRSFNMRMPEEVNRILTDRVSTLLLCPTDNAVANLAREGLTQGVHNVGDVMYDAALYYSKQAEKTCTMLDTLGLPCGGYALCTCHRAENTDDLDRFRGIIAAMNELAQRLPVVFPVHPRTRKILEASGISIAENLILCEPFAFFDMLHLEKSARLVLTDSGGVQKEAYYFEVPCVTLRDETEWVETVQAGANVLAGADTRRILECACGMIEQPLPPCGKVFGEGRAAHLVLERVLEYCL